MTIKADLVARWAVETGVVPATVENRIHNMTPRHIRKSPQGRGGPRSVHLNAYELFCVALSEASYGPGDAGLAADGFASLPCISDETIIQSPNTGSAVTKLSGETVGLENADPETLGEWGARTVMGFGHPDMRDNVRRNFRSFSLLLSRDPFRATVTFSAITERGLERTTLTFANPDEVAEQHPIRPQRQVLIPLGMLLMCGEFYEDSVRVKARVTGEPPSILGIELPPETAEGALPRASSLEAQRKGADHGGVGSTARSTPGTPAHLNTGELNPSHGQISQSGRPEQAGRRTGHFSKSTRSYDDAGLLPGLSH
jgi:hypothetical protein